MLCIVGVVTNHGKVQRKNILAMGITLQKARQVVDECADNRVYIIEII